MKKTERSPGLDIIRCIALLFVIGIHFFLKTGFYEEIVVGWRMSIMVYMRTLFMTSVPLFLLLSGYLLHNKKVSRSYYCRIFKILVTYVLAGFLCILYESIVNHANYSIPSMVLLLLCYHEKMYFWYINMYIGLFLMAPFLNVMYHGLETQSHKRILVWSFLALTAFPSLVNVYQIADMSWWLNPASSVDFHRIMPNWWTGIYPVTYYLLGCYLREYPLKFKRRTKLLLVALSIFVAGTYNLYRSYGSPFQLGDWADHSSLLSVFQSVCIFSLFQDIPANTIGPRLSKCFQKVSEWSLAAYLLSWIPDQYVYPFLIAYEPSVPMQLKYFPVIVTINLVCSLALAAVVDWCSSQIHRSLIWMTASFCKKVSVK